MIERRIGAGGPFVGSHINRGILNTVLPPDISGLGIISVIATVQAGGVPQDAKIISTRIHKARIRVNGRIIDDGSFHIPNRIGIYIGKA